MPSDTTKEKGDATGHGHRHHKERIGNYVVGAEIGRGSFATVYKGYRSKTRDPIAIKAVSRQKLTTKLLENLESEINILKAISHPNITALEDCFKNDSHIYLVMEYCSGSDLSVYIKNRGRLPTLDYVPRGNLDGNKVFYPHPPSGGIDERVTRSFLGQLAHALEFLRKQNLIHRDIKPQNLLLQPASQTDLAAGHPIGVPLLKVADFGFARILPASAMAETLCGSPLYMAPEILRYERYDAKVDLWSVGAVLYEMSVGKPPFRAANHVELLRKIEKGEDRIKFPDESSRTADPDAIPALPVPMDVKTLIRALLKRHAVDRMSFEAFFASNHVWESSMFESHSTEEDSLSLEVSTDSSADGGSRIKELVESAGQRFRDAPKLPIQPIASDPALNPQPAPTRSDPEQQREAPLAPPVPPHPQPVSRPPPLRRSEPKYYVQDDAPAQPQVVPEATPRPIQTPLQTQRRASHRELASVEENQPITPSSNLPPMLRTRGVSEGSPLAATPPITMSTGKDESALEGDDSMVARDYVVIEKRTVEVNALADELDHASRQPTNILTRRPSTRISVVSRPISSFRPSDAIQSRSPGKNAISNAAAPISYSPPFGLSSTPPFAIPPVSRQSSHSKIQVNILNRTPSQNLNVFPPVQMYDRSPRYSSSPSAQPGALARVLTNTARRVLGTTAIVASNALALAANARRPSVVRTRQIDPEEDGLLNQIEGQARFAFVLYEFGDERLTTWQHLNDAAAALNSAASSRRPSSGSSNDSQVDVLRQQETAAGQACILFVKALAFIVRAMRTIREFTDKRSTDEPFQASQELNDIVQWLRARFNECVEKVEFAKTKYAANELPFIERELFDRARELSIAAANKEKEGDFDSAERGYESALWLVQTMLDEIIWDGRVRDEDRATVDAWIGLIGERLANFRAKLASRQRQTTPASSSAPTGVATATMGDRAYSSSVPSQSRSATPSAATVVAHSPASLTPTSVLATGSTAAGTAPGTAVRSTYKPATSTYTPAPLHQLPGMTP